MDKLLFFKNYDKCGLDWCRPWSKVKLIFFNLFFTHMFLFLFLSSRSMMKCCVLGGSSIRLGIVLLSPHSQAPGPGHAAAMRHLGGLPLLPSFLYQGFLLLWTGAAGIHQQLSADWRGSTPSSSFSCSSSPPTSLLKTTHTHTVLHARFPSLDAYPWFLARLFVCLFVYLTPFYAGESYPRLIVLYWNSRESLSCVNVIFCPMQMWMWQAN